MAVHPQVRTLLQMCEAPDDAPDIVAVHLALVHCLTAVADRQPAVRPLAMEMRDIPRADLLSAQAPSTSVVPLLARRGRVATWASLREIGRTDLSKLPAQVATTALAILGAALLRGLLAGSRVDGKIVARARDALARPNSHAAQAWSFRARERSLSSQLRLLEQSLLAHSVAARGLGLTPPATVQLEAQSSSAAVLNNAIKRRVTAVSVFAPPSLTRAADGHGSLAEAAIADSGRYLRAAASAGDDVALMMCLELLTNLTPKVIVTLPLDPAPDERGIAPLAWIDVGGARYCHVAWWLRERGARPGPNCRGLYVPASDTVSVPMPAFLHRQLMQRLASTPHAKVVGDLCATGQHHPWCAADQGGGGYRVSVRRLHRGVVSQLIGRDLGRLPVALLTGCLSLVSKGRIAYGLVTQAQLDTTAEHVYRCLDWGQFVEAQSTPGQHFGSAVTPSDDAVQRVFRLLSEQVDMADEALDKSEPESVRVYMNSLNAWLSALIAFLLALRNATEYAIRAHELQQSFVHVDDKRVHALGPGPALPVLPLLRTAVTHVERQCASVASSLTAVDPNHPIHAAVAAFLAPDRPAVQWITSSWAVEAGGADGWRQALPLFLRLVPNFGRHFWPHRLAARGIGQAEIDVLLRHSANDIESTSTATTTPPLHRHRRLVDAMEAELQALDLPLPRCLA